MHRRFVCRPSAVERAVRAATVEAGSAVARMATTGGVEAVASWAPWRRAARG